MTDYRFIILNGLKRCRKCFECKTLDNFTKCKRSLEGYRPRCHKCEYAYKKKRKENNLQTKLIQNIRIRIYEVLKRHLNKKSASSIELLGCTMAEYVIYLEQKFEPGMTWDNYGLRGWHIDHIKPFGEFDLSDPEQIKLAFHYSNTQPLWAHDNWRKKKVRLKK